MVFVSMLPAKEKLDLYKKVKGVCLFEGYDFVQTMTETLNEKAKDVYGILDYEYPRAMEDYKDYSYGRY